MIEKLLSFPATAYILSFGGLGILLMLALNSLHKNFTLANRTWGLLTLGCGACGGVLLQLVGFVDVPGADGIGFVLSAFVGAAVAAAAAGFSAVDLRSTLSSKFKE